MKAGDILASFIALLGFASALVYLFRDDRKSTRIVQLSAGLSIMGGIASFINLAVSALHFTVSALLVGTLLFILLSFVPLGMFLVGYPNAMQMGFASLGVLVLFIVSRLVFPFGNGAGLAGVLALFLLVVWLIMLYQFHQGGKISGTKNRFTYLLAATSLFLISSLFLASGLTGLSLLGMAAGTWLAILLVKNNQLPDLRYIHKSRYAPKFLQRIFGSNAYDSGRVMREFSLGISNITSPELLATVSIGLISEAVELNRGFLFSVDRENIQISDTYRLQGEGGIGQLPEELKVTIIQANNPVVQHLIKTHDPIRLEDLPGLPGFQLVDKAEFQWFTKLEMEVFAPVHTKEQWIGLICLGPKTSGLAYNDNDLELVGTLADQLSLALQNARLIESIMRVNNDFRRAYTAMEQSNRQLQQAVNQLEKIDHTKSDFISVASHELRTPLTLIRGYTEMLLEEQSVRENEFQAKTVSGIYSGILRLQEILESLLDVASLDARSFSLSRQPVSINQLVSSIHKKLKPVLEERNLNLFTENLSILPVIEADGTALNKVFFNLITNAIKYTPDGGTVTVSGVLVSPGQLGFTGGGIEIIIADSGIGIDRENLELIFNKFYQTGQVSLHSSGKTKYRGSGPGLGLAIAKGIIEAHGGKIWAESKGYNEETFPGSQFHIVLPVSKRDSPVL